MAKRTMPVKETLKKTTSVKEEPVANSDFIENPNTIIKLVVDNCQKLNVRQSPSKESKVLFVIPAGTIVFPDQMNEEWLHIYFIDKKGNRQEGYILGQYAKEV